MRCLAVCLGLLFILHHVTTQSVPDISPLPWVFGSDRLPGDIRYMPSVSNGHIATNVYTDTVYINGLYSGPGGWSHRARIPSFHASNFSVRGVALSDHSRTYNLDVWDGVFIENTSTSQADFEYRTYAHHYYNRLLVTDLTVTRKSGHTGNIVINRDDLQGGPSEDFYFINDTDAGGGYRLYFAHINISESETSGLTPLYLLRNEIPDTLTLPANQSTERWVFLVSADMNEDAPRADLNDALAILQQANGPDNLLKIHTDGWTRTWRQGRIVVEGDLELQKVVWGSLYYLYSNLPSMNTSQENNLFYGLSPGGLSNGMPRRDYYGHVFWDMETWMYPGILMLRPDLAKQMLMYRMNGMVPAYERARKDWYDGTRFPWESGQTGAEVTPDICPKCRENQQHITGDIAFAGRQYVSATRDTDWLGNYTQKDGYNGFDFFREMARFWYSRPTWNESRGMYEVNGVMAPDEHADTVNNSIFTNVGASYSVRDARYIACLAGKDPEAEIPERWVHVTKNLVFNFNQKNRYHEEYDGYDHERVTNTTDPRGVKQADVVLLAFPLLWQMPDDVRRNDLVYYESQTHPQGPAMTWSMYAINWLELGNRDEAGRLFNKSYIPYYRNPFKIWTETQRGLGAVNFITGMGGFLQGVMFGYGGMRLRHEVLDFFAPKLPPGATRIKMYGVKYLGSVFDLDITQNEKPVLTVQRANSEFPLVIKIGNADPQPFTEGQTFTPNGENFSIYTTRQTNCEIPQKYINVDYNPQPSPTSPVRPPATCKSAVTSPSTALVSLLTGVIYTWARGLL